MLWVIFAGSAFAYLFSAPPANAPAVRFRGSAPVIESQPQVIELQMPQYIAPQTSGSTLPNTAIGVAFIAAGFLAGKHAMLFFGGRNSTPKARGAPKATRPAARRPAPKAAAKPEKLAYRVDKRPDNRGAPYSGAKTNGRPGVQTQKSGFGNFVQRFQKAEGKSKYGVPIFDKNGNINPAYLAAERKEQKQQQLRNIRTAEAKRKGLINSGAYELADYVRKKIGPVGSNKDYYESGR